MAKDNAQPKIALELSTFDRLAEGMAAAVALLLFIVPLVYYADLPARIPQHYNAAGEVDIYGPKYLLWVVVGTGLILYAGITFLQQRPHWFNYPVRITPENAKQQYYLATRLLRVLKVMLLLLFFYLTWRTIRIALGEPAVLSLWVVGGLLGVNAAFMGWYFWRALTSKAKQ